MKLGDAELQPIFNKGRDEIFLQISKTSKEQTIKPVSRVVLKASALIGLWYDISNFLNAHSLVLASAMDRLWFDCIHSNVSYYSLTSCLRYFLSTILSMWNRKLLDREHGGILDKGPFPGTPKSVCKVCIAILSCLLPWDPSFKNASLSFCVCSDLVAIPRLIGISAGNASQNLQSLKDLVQARDHFWLLHTPCSTALNEQPAIWRSISHCRSSP